MWKQELNIEKIKIQGRNGVISRGGAGLFTIGRMRYIHGLSSSV